MERILADFEKLIVPGMTHWNHPGFMAYFANHVARPRHSGRDAGGGAQRQWHGLEDVAGGDGTGAGDARLAARVDGIAGATGSA